jgi:CRP-like cAMP-binding protein
MRRDGKTDLLKRVSLFEDCSMKELSRIAAIADEISVKAGATLMREGGLGQEMLVIADGRVRVSKGKRTLARLGPGEVVGELSLLDRGPRSATVTADTDVRAYLLDARGFSSLMLDFPSVAVKVARTLARRMRGTQGATKP